MRVLVVEDDPSVSHWLGSKLHASGHNCRLTDNGECALQMIGDEVFDVVILDRILPRMDGIEVLQRLHGQSRPPILILSANDQSSDRVEGLRAGADDYLGKPFDFTELLLRLELLARRHNSVSSSDQLQVHDLFIDLGKRSVRRGTRNIDLTDKANVYEAMLLSTAVETMRTIIAQNPDLTEQTDKAITTSLQAYRERKGELLDQIARIYALTFSMEELQVVVDFYGSEVGQKLAVANQTINERVQTVVGLFNDNLRREFFAKVRAELKAAGFDV